VVNQGIGPFSVPEGMAYDKKKARLFSETGFLIFLFLKTYKPVSLCGVIMATTTFKRTRLRTLRFFDEYVNMMN
jgi:hypothetical protein